MSGRTQSEVVAASASDPPLGAELVGGRYRLLAALGTGGGGDVYEAVDTDSGAVVALKILRGLSPERESGFKREFRALADIEHPNLIRLGELHCDRGLWFFTMERVAGVGFLDHVRTRIEAGADQATATVAVADETEGDATATLAVGTDPVDDGTGLGPAIVDGGPDLRWCLASAARPWDELDLGRLRSALGQLAVAIHAVHATGRVHGDIKPSNAMVRADGSVVLLDFGLVRELTEVRRSRGGQVVTAGDDGQSTWRSGLEGTPSYMAPEQVVGGPVGPAADWYALGGLLFQALIGTPPYVGPTSLRLRAKCVLDAPRVRALVAEAPADLDQLCVDLLQIDAGRRPSGDDILPRLGVLSVPATAASTDSSRDHDTPFVGRRDELAVLTAAFARSRAGSPEAVLLCGEPGIGKTALRRQFIEQAGLTVPSLLVARGRCYEQESVPFKAFDTIIDSLVRYLERAAEADVELFVAGGVGFVATAFPIFRRLPVVAARVAAARTVIDAGELRRAAFHELKAIMAAVARRETVVICIDDLQWADRDSLALLTELLVPAGSAPCLVVATARTDDHGRPLLPADAGPALTEVFRVVHLAALGSVDAEQVVRDAMGGTVDAGSLDRMVGEARGHPLFLKALALHSRSHRRTAPVGLEQVLWQRIEALDDEPRRLLEISALVGVPAKAELLARAADIDPGRCLVLLNQLRAAQLVRIVRRGRHRLIEPYHDRIREAAVRRQARASLPSSARMGLEVHRRLGTLLWETAEAGERDDQIFIALRHLHLAAPLLTTAAERRWLAELDQRAAVVAGTATAHEVALGHIDRALQLVEADPEASDLVQALSRHRLDVLYLAGRVDDARRQFEALRAAVTSDRDRGDLYAARITFDSIQGRFDEALATARDGLAALGVHLPAAPGKVAVLRELVVVQWLRGRRTASELAALPDLDDPRLEAAMFLISVMSPVAYFVDPMLLAVVILRSTRITLGHGLSRWSPHAFSGYAFLRSSELGAHADADQLAELGERIDARLGGPDADGQLLFQRGVYLTPWVHPYAVARAQVEQALIASQRRGDTAYEAYSACGIAAMVHYQAGPLPEVRAVAAAHRDIAAARRNRGMTAICDCIVAHCDALMGSSGSSGSSGSPDPLAESGPTAAAISDEHTPLASFWLFLLRAELGYLLGQPDEAWAWSEQAEQRADVQKGQSTLVEHHLFRVLITCRLTGSWRQRLRWRRARRRSMHRLEQWAAASPANFAPLAAIARGELLRVAGDRDGAGRELLAAAEAASSRGALRHQALAVALAAAAATDGDRRRELVERAAALYRQLGVDPALVATLAARDQARALSGPSDATVPDA